MRVRPHRPSAVLAAVAAAVVLSACGSTASSSSTATAISKPTSTGTTPTAGPAPAASVQVYKVALTGAAAVGPPPGAPGASASATIRLLASGSVCWRFSHLSGVSRPTRAALNPGPAGYLNGTLATLADHYASRGCTTLAAAKIGLIESDYHYSSYNVIIYSKRYPAGAVRGQLAPG